MDGHLFRRGGIYWARAYRNGRDYRTSLKTGDRSVARKRVKTWLARLDTLAWGDRPRISFSEAVRSFILEYLPTLKPQSARRYGVSLKALAGSLEGISLDQIEKGRLADFESLRRSRGASAPTIRRDLQCLSSLMTHCEDKDWIEKNPVPAFLRGRAKRGLKESPPRTRYLSHDEETRLIAGASSPLRQAIMLAIDSGLRKEELFSLTWPQVDLRTRTITTTKDTKNGRERVVPFGERSAHFLAQWKAANQSARVASVHVFHHPDDDRHGLDGQRFAGLDKGFQKLVQRVGIPDLIWHDLRRTAGCRWLQDQRKSPGEVMIMLGHSSVTVTERSYAFLEGRKVAEETAARAGQQS